MCRLIWRASVRWDLGGALLERGWPHNQAFDKVWRYGVVAVRRGQEVGVWVSGYSAEVYASPVGRGGAGAAAGRQHMVTRSGGCGGCTGPLWGVVPRIW